MHVSAQQLADFLQGTIIGDADRVVTRFAPIESAESDCLSFIANPKYQDFLGKTKAGVLLVSKDLNLSGNHPTLIQVEDPYLSLTILLEKFSNSLSEFEPGIHPTASIEETAKVAESAYVGAKAIIEAGAEIGEKVCIGPGAWVGKNVKVGNGCRIDAGAKLYQGTIIGENCTIQSGTVVGSAGFGFAPQPDGTYRAIPQVGIVRIGNSVHIGANTTIDRATLGETVIGDGVKIDNLCQIAHNVVIGANTVIASQTGIAGSSKIGKNCVLAGQVGVTGHITIADGVQVGGQSGVQRSVKETNAKLHGSPALPLNHTIRLWAINKILPDMVTQLRQLQDSVKELQSSALVKKD
jgi:UDP-3-O-[3-hydroxymyristoyl] glucosamine N-acyltransferase